MLGDAYGSGNSLLSNPRVSHQRWSAVVGEANVVIPMAALVSTWLGLEAGRTFGNARLWHRRRWHGAPGVPAQRLVAGRNGRNRRVSLKIGANLK